MVFLYYVIIKYDQTTFTFGYNIQHTLGVQTFVSAKFCDF